MPPFLPLKIIIDCASLPPFKRIYYLQEVENQHLKDILDYLVAADVIVRCGINDGGPFSGFASPAYIVEKQCQSDLLSV